MTHQHGHRHGHQVSTHGHDAHGSADDLALYVSKLEDPDRDAWQQPEHVVASLALSPGTVVAEIGSGSGYFTRRLARAVGHGHVFAIDVEPRLLGVLLQRLVIEGLTNVTPVLALPDDPLLPPSSCDRVMIVNTLHHFANPMSSFSCFAHALKPGGLIANIDFHKRESAVGPPMALRIAREDCIDQARAAGLELASELTFLEHQYFLLLRRR